MSPAWEVLRAAGVPSGAIRAVPTDGFDAGRLPAALSALCDADFVELDDTERECLFAWLRAFQHHWPERFEALLPRVGSRALNDLKDSRSDANRYLKLRRIAIENLAGSL
jgi:hypothetical protein